MSWWSYIPAVISGASAIWSSSQQAEGASVQNDWSTFNAGMSYLTNQQNIESQAAITQYNANALMQTAGINASISASSAAYNADVIMATTLYNDELYEQELASLWEAAELDQMLLAQQRSRERGGIVAIQASSGTLIGEGSNAQVIVDQKTQENLDALVIQRGADKQATDIANARAKGMWEGQMAVQKTLWEGQLSSYKTIANANIAAGSMMAESAIATQAATQSNNSQLLSNMFGASNNLAAGNQQAQNTLVSGLFSAAGSAVGTYYQNQSASLIA